VYSKEGAQDKDNSDYKIHLDYINITALFRYNSRGFFVGIGPQLGVLGSAKVKYMGNSDDIKDDLKSTNIAAAIAAGYELPNGLGFYARYNLGLVNIGSESGDDIKTTGINIGLRFSLNPEKSGKDPKKD
ncbi:MAG: PorT family protein, partial [Bacteroidia bacterium]|nr:PorT family protein [Bacteroidia bacterium]